MACYLLFSFARVFSIVENTKQRTTWRQTVLDALKHWMKPAMPIAAALVMTMGLAGAAQAYDDDDGDWHSGQHHWHSGPHHEWHSGQHEGWHGGVHWSPWYGWHYGEHYGGHGGPHHEWHSGSHHDWHSGHDDDD
jgi:hypothetical protein